MGPRARASDCLAITARRSLRAASRSTCCHPRPDRGGSLDPPLVVAHGLVNLTAHAAAPDSPVFRRSQRTRRDATLRIGRPSSARRPRVYDRSQHAELQFRPARGRGTGTGRRTVARRHPRPAKLYLSVAAQKLRRARRGARQLYVHLRLGRSAGARRGPGDGDVAAAFPGAQRVVRLRAAATAAVARNPRSMAGICHRHRFAQESCADQAGAVGREFPVPPGDAHPGEFTRLPRLPARQGRGR